MKKHIIIVDDTEYKRERIKSYVNSVVDNVNFTEFCCSRDFINWLRTNISDNMEWLHDAMLFLDWNFPVYKNDRISLGEGRKILTQLDIRNIPLKTVIVSSEYVDERSMDYEFVVGFIKDDAMTYQQQEYLDVLIDTGVIDAEIIEYDNDYENKE